MARVLFVGNPKAAKAERVDCIDRHCGGRTCGSVVLGILVEAPEELLYSQLV
jgi:hypothetical protein